jgi:hypothetical protein
MSRRGAADYELPLAFRDRDVSGWRARAEALIQLTIQLEKYSAGRSFGVGDVLGMAMQHRLCNRFHVGRRGAYRWR